MHPRYQAAIVFDLDNTLVHSRIDFPRMRQRVIELVVISGLRLPIEEPLSSFSTSEIIDLVCQHAAPPDLLAEMWTAVSEEEMLGMEMATVENDAVPVLAALKDHGVSLAVLTNNARPAALAALGQFNLLVYLDLVLARDDVTSLKPSPAGLQVARESLGADKVMALVGDASIDGIAANRANVPFIAFRPAIAEMDRRGVDRWATIEQLSEVQALIPRLLER